MQAESKAKPVERRAHNSFRFCIAAFDPRHIPTASFSRESVHSGLQPSPPEYRGDTAGNLSGKKWRDRISHLCVLGCSRTAEKIVVRKRLNSGRLTHRQASALRSVIVNIVVAIFGDVAGNCGRWSIPHLHAEAIGK